MRRWRIIQAAERARQAMAHSATGCAVVSGVTAASSAAERGGAVEAPRTRLGEFPVDERQRLPAIGVNARAHQPGRGGEARPLKVAQQRVHGRRPRPGLADDHVTAAVDRRPAAALQSNQVIQ
jgi:hypothetical protein